MNIVYLPEARTDIMTIVIIILHTAHNFGPLEVDDYKQLLRVT